MNERYVCIHGHFYQPPRENPWLEAIQAQPSAHPYHDWNEKVTAECYAANASSRILDRRGLIKEMINNYAMMSFNFGPTLLSWMEIKAPEVYEAVLEADRLSREMFSGHGSAIAQAYNHMILPLANRRDKHTQIAWGIADFRRRFGRFPEGMWLPETGVDLESLEIMAEQGISFTILAPHQAGRVRNLGSGRWKEIPTGGMDTTQPYVLRLPSGRSIVIFFYNGAISRAVAFEKLLSDGETFALRLAGEFSEGSGRPQLSHIATDGETYGHHHRFGDMALAYALRYIPARNLARLTIYGEYLEKYPPSQEVEIIENTSWSCAHGIERWRSDCGCRLGGEQGWNQAWRVPLRGALDWLRDSLTKIFEESAQPLLKEPWSARNEYIKVILDRSEENIEAFLARHSTKELRPEEKIKVLSLMEMQRNAMLMYTSCGWFFDDLAGIETVQVIQYAARALELAQNLSGRSLEDDFLGRLEKARSNAQGRPDGRRIYEEKVRPSFLDMERVAAHFAISSLFQNKNSHAETYCYRATIEDRRVCRAGRSKLVNGRMRVRSRITWEEKGIFFSALHMGDHNIVCGVGREADGDEPGRHLDEIAQAFSKGSIPESLRIMDKHFGRGIHSIESLLKDGQNEVLDLILEPSLKEAEAVYQKLYEDNAPLMRYLKEAGATPPRMLYMAAEAVLNTSIRRAFEDMNFIGGEIKALLDEVRTQGIKLDEEGLDYAARNIFVRLGKLLLENPGNSDAMERLLGAVTILDLLPFKINLWEVQNAVYKLIRLHSASFKGVSNNSLRFLAERLFIAFE